MNVEFTYARQFSQNSNVWFAIYNYKCRFVRFLVFFFFRINSKVKQTFKWHLELFDLIFLKFNLNLNLKFNLSSRPMICGLWAFQVTGFSSSGFTGVIFFCTIFHVGGSYSNIVILVLVFRQGVKHFVVNIEFWISSIWDFLGLNNYSCFIH